MLFRPNYIVYVDMPFSQPFCANFSIGAYAKRDNHIFFMWWRLEIGRGGVLREKR